MTIDQIKTSVEIVMIIHNAKSAQASAAATLPTVACTADSAIASSIVVAVADAVCCHSADVKVKSEARHAQLAQH